MENLLDHLFSSNWMLITIFMVALLATSFIAYSTNFFKNKYLNWIYKGIAIILPFSPIIIDMFFPIKYGFSYEVPAMYIVRDKLCLLDKKEKGDESSDWEEYRLHVLDAKTGVKLSRHFYDDISDIGYSIGDSIFLFGYWKYIVVDINLNKPVSIVDKEYLQSRFSEFSAGIESMDYSKQDNEGNQILSISVTSKTAKTYYYDPFSDSLLSNEKIEQKQALTKFAKEGAYYMNNPQKEEESNFSLEYSEESNKIKHISFKNKEIDSISEIKKKEFLEAEILEIFHDQKIFIVLSYETTDKLNFILDAISYDGKLKWTLRQSEMNLTDRYSKKTNLNTAIKYNENLIFNCGGFIVSLNANTGDINWKQRI